MCYRQRGRCKRYLLKGRRVEGREVRKEKEGREGGSEVKGERETKEKLGSMISKERWETG